MVADGLPPIPDTSTDEEPAPKAPSLNYHKLCLDQERLSAFSWASVQVRSHESEKDHTQQADFITTSSSLTVIRTEGRYLEPAEMQAYRECLQANAAEAVRTRLRLRFREERSSIAVRA
jgi:hypothetical protein